MFYFYIVREVWRYALLICDLVEVADKITRLFGLTVKSPLAECHRGRSFLSEEERQLDPPSGFVTEVVLLCGDDMYEGVGVQLEFSPISPCCVVQWNIFKRYSE